MGWNGVNALEKAGSAWSRLSCVVCDVADAEKHRRVESANVHDGAGALDESVKVARAESTYG